MAWKLLSSRVGPNDLVRDQGTPPDNTVMAPPAFKKAPVKKTKDHPTPALIAPGSKNDTPDSTEKENEADASRGYHEISAALQEVEARDRLRSALTKPGPYELLPRKEVREGYIDVTPNAVIWVERLIEAASLSRHDAYSLWNMPFAHVFAGELYYEQAPLAAWSASNSLKMKATTAGGWDKAACRAEAMQGRARTVAETGRTRVQKPLDLPALRISVDAGSLRLMGKITPRHKALMKWHRENIFRG